MKRLALGTSILLPYLLVLVVVLLRLAANHPYNFIPVFSCLVFFGACRPVREYGLPLFTLVGLDIFLTTHQYGFALTTGQSVTWFLYLATTFLGGALLGRQFSASRVLGASASASVLFFVASNFAVWVEWSMYPKTWGGLASCYVAALPFFRNSIVSEIACSLLILAAVGFGERLLLAKRIHGACSGYRKVF